MTFRTHFVDPSLQRRIDQLELALDLVDALLDHHEDSTDNVITTTGGALIGAVALVLMLVLHLGAVPTLLVMFGLTYGFVALVTRRTRRKVRPLLDHARTQGLAPMFFSTIAWGSPAALVVQHNVWLVCLRWALYQADRPMAEASRRALAGDLLVHRSQLDDEQQSFVDAMLEEHGVTPIKARAWASCRKDRSRNGVGCTQCAWPGRREPYLGR